MKLSRKLKSQIIQLQNFAFSLTDFLWCLVASEEQSDETQFFGWFSYNSALLGIGTPCFNLQPSHSDLELASSDCYAFSQ